jgi:ParB family transcriptional regulator, chromosome partitioning protein
MPKKTGLGRGLAALLGEATDDVALPASGLEQPALPTAGIVDLPIGTIRRNPRQPRRAIEPGALDELATSIAAVGVVQPVIVREIDGGYELIAGERRWRAAQKAGFTVIPAIVRAASDVESLELALIENVVRQQLNPVDEAYALKVLLEDLGVTQESLAARVGKSRSAIANKIRLLDLPQGVQESLAAGALAEGHARALLGLDERGKQLQLARRVVEKGLSVRQVEEEVRRLAVRSKPESSRVASSLDRDLVDQVRDSLFGLLGVMPRIKGRGTGGVIELPFKDTEELQNLARKLP